MLQVPNPLPPKCCSGPFLVVPGGVCAAGFRVQGHVLQPGPGEAPAELPASTSALCSCHSDAFAKLLESGDLSVASIRVDGISMSFQTLLAKICFYHHFSGKGPAVLVGSPSSPTPVGSSLRHAHVPLQ